MNTPITGVSFEISKRMEAVQATKLREDNLLQRLCEHGIWHPVDHLSSDHGIAHWTEDQLKYCHEATKPGGLRAGAACCGCCSNWK